MNKNFIPLLREAHAIVTAYNRGAKTVAQLSVRTGLQVFKVASWCNQLGLRLEAPEEWSHSSVGPTKSVRTNAYINLWNLK